MDQDRLTLEPSSPDHPEAAELIDELNALLDDLYDPDENHFLLAPEEVTREKGVFLIAREGDRAVGCGAVRLLADGRAEVKRMYVRPEAQGARIASAILSRLEAEAVIRGASGLVLEMGPRQPAARRLYEAFGFRPVPCWGEYLGTVDSSVCLGKDL